MKTASSHRLMLFSAAPFIGVLCWLLFSFPSTELHAIEMPVSERVSFANDIEPISAGLGQAKTDAVTINERMSVYSDSYAKSAQIANDLAYRASRYVNKPIHIYDNRVTSLLGSNPLHHVQSQNIDLKIFPIKENRYSGYAMKVELKKPEAMTMVLGKDKLGSSETTLQAVNRYDAVAGVNAGGFADNRRTGMRYPLSTTMVDGKYVNGFTPTFKDLFFVGLNKEGKLIGGEFTHKDELDQLGPVFGASFVPILIRDGVKQDIPSKWLTSPVRAARTVIANYKHDHLLFLVINGTDETGSSGASLPELQQKLLSLGVVDAYNLDGGGSTSLVFKGEVLNNPSDGKLRPLPTHFLFFE